MTDRKALTQTGEVARIFLLNGCSEQNRYQSRRENHMRIRMSASVVALLVLTGVASAQETSGGLTETGAPDP